MPNALQYGIGCPGAPGNLLHCIRCTKGGTKATNGRCHQLQCCQPESGKRRSRRREDHHHGAAHRGHRSRRLLHPDEHGLAADLAGRASSTRSTRSGATWSTTRTARRATCRPACGWWRRRCCASYAADDIAVCYPDDLDKFIGPDTRVVAVSTHNPLGVTFAAGVYTSIFGSSKQPINSHYRAQLFADIKASPHRENFKVIVGGSGGWQIIQTDTLRRARRRLRRRRPQRIRRDARAVPQGACAASRCRAQIDVGHPKSRDDDHLPRQAHDLRRGRDDDRLRPPLPVLPARPESADRPAEGQDHGGGARQRARGQQADLAGHRGHVHLGTGAHRHAVLFPESRGAARSLSAKS